MQSFTSKFSMLVAVSVVLFSVTATAHGHHTLNGTWKLIPNRGEFNGEPVIQTGTVTINDREHNVYVSRSYTYDSRNQVSTSQFTTDGRVGSTIRNGKTFKSKAKWDGDTLVVTTTEGDDTGVERYTLEPDGSMRLVISRPGHALTTLYFERGS